MVIKIAISGTHGIGKSTLVKRFEAELKERDYVVEVMDEIVRMGCPFPISEKGNINSQLWILFNTLKEEIVYRNKKCDFIIFDRSIYDCGVYERYLFDVGKIRLTDHITYKHLLQTVFLSRKFDYDHIFLLKGDFTRKILKDNIRSTNKNYQKQIDKRFEDVFAQYFQYPIVLHNQLDTVNKRLEVITRILMEQEQI